MTEPDDTPASGVHGVPDAAALILPDGRRIVLDRDVVIGRAPIAPDESPAARSVSLGTPTVSKTHALIGCTGRVVWAIDLHSSNGSEIVDPSGAATALTPGAKTTVAPGCGLRLGTEVLITVERPLVGDDDPTVVRDVGTSAQGSPTTIVPEQPGRDGRALPAASDAVDWSVEMDPPPGSPPTQPPPPIAPPRQQPAATAGVLGPDNPAAAGRCARRLPPASHMPPAPMTPGPAAPRGRSAAHVVGALVVLGWGMVSGWRLLEIGPDVLFENLDGWPSRFFSQVSRDEFEFFELFSLVPTPDFLSPIVLVLAAAVCVLALSVLVSGNRSLRFLTVGAVGVVLFLMAGFAVDYFVAFGVDSLEFTLPNFVLPVIGCGLLLWPSGPSRTPTPPFAPQAQPGVFYAPQQSPPPPGAPPFGGQP